MELRQLRYFLSVADNRSFASAASSLFISRQAVSKAVSQLEEELGVELFVRDSSGAFLTPTGLMFYEQIRVTVMDLDNITEQIRASGSRFRQRIRIGLSIGCAGLLEERLRNYRDHAENLEITYREFPEEECTRLLTEHRLDLVISTAENREHLFTSEKLFSSRLGILLRRQDKGETMEALDVADLSWIPLAGATDSQITAFCGKYNLALSYQGFDYCRLFALTQAGKCGMLLPECLVPNFSSELVWVPLQQQEFWTLYATYPQIIENNNLYSVVLDELNHQVFQHIGAQ